MESSKKYARFVMVKQDKVLQNKTEVYVGYNKEYLFTAFICHEKNMSKIKASIQALEARDTNIWTDDCVEVLLDPLGSGSECYHLIVNSNGIFYDSLNRDASWNSNIKVAAKKYKDHWIVEMAIPFSDLDYAPSGGEQWRGNFCREQKQYSENSSLFKTRSFTTPSTFGALTFLSSKDEDSPIKLSINQLWNEDNPAVKLSIKNSEKAPQKIAVSILNTVNRKIFSKISQNIVINPLQSKSVVIPYKTSNEKQNVILTISDLNANRTLYHNQFQLAAKEKEAAISKRVWNISNPLYTELFSDEEFGLGKDGVLCWMPASHYNKMRSIARQFGRQYRYEDVYKLYANNKLHAFTNPFVQTSKSYQQTELSRKHGMKSVLFADNRKYSKGKIPFSAKYKRPWAVDPVAVNASLQVVKETLDGRKDVVWGVALGDEIEGRILKIGIEFFNKYSKGGYPYVHKVDQEVQDKYGYGKYGIPLNQHDANPFRWIAYRRWVNQELVKLHAKLYEMVKNISPEIKLVSNDPIAFHNPLDYRNIKCDVMTHQLYPRRDVNRARFGFLTKLNVDLSGHKEFWPCTHVENYASNFNDTEVLELMSQVIRNGGVLDFICGP